MKKSKRRKPLSSQVTARLEIRLSEKSKRLIEKNAAKVNLCVTAYILSRCCGGKP